MDGSTIAAIVTAFGGAVAAIIGATALLLRAATPTSRTKNALRGLWYWIEAHEPPIVAKIPPRLLRDVQKALAEDERADSAEEGDSGSVLKRLDPRLIADVNAAKVAEREVSP